MRSLENSCTWGERVFVRADLDVSLEEYKVGNREREIGSEVQIEGAIRLARLKPTVDYLLEEGRSVIIGGHIGRPSEPDQSLSTKRLIQPLKKILKADIEFHGDISRRPRARIVLLENLRFAKGETSNDAEFARRLAPLADMYVNEAFGNSHREHASMVALPKLLPSYAGFNLTREMQVLSDVLDKPQRPFVAVVGGAKIETKLPVIENLAKVADTVLVGGMLPAELSVNPIAFPDNVLVAQVDDSGKDITRESQERFASIIRESRTVVWNGAMGVFERGYAEGTLQIARAIIDSKGFSVAGGGQTTEFLTKYHLTDRFSFVSSGGGAMLEFLAGKNLPGVEVLS